MKIRLTNCGFVYVNKSLDLYNAIISIILSPRNGTTPFLEELKNKFDNYLAAIDSNSIKDKYIEDISQIKVVCDSIYKAVEYQYKGLHSLAFQEIVSLLEGNKNGFSFASKLKKEIICKTNSFYRMRVFDEYERMKASYNDMFHIPFEKRGIVSTQRYSVPGYPCLYLGSSVYGCWEEMHRPFLSKCMTSLFMNTQDVTLLDLRIPKYEEFRNEDNKALFLLPLIISCMIKTSDDSHNFKPEYIIPQLLLEWMLERKEKDDNSICYDGIYYTSVLREVKPIYSPDKSDNIVIPVKQCTKENGYCDALMKMFQLTDPTCVEFEKLKNVSVKQIDTEDDYQKSDFYLLEQALHDSKIYELKSMYKPSSV